MKTFDAHAHLDHLENLEEALENAREAGVKGIIAVSMDLESSKKNLKIKHTVSDPVIYIGMGMHPSEANAQQVDEVVKLIRENSSELTVVGEIGLDFWYKWVRKDQEKKDEQRLVYRKLLEVAHELDLPAVIHSRGVWREAFETAKEVGLKRAEFHWYDGPIDVLDDIINAGYYISTAPSVAYSPESQKAVLHAPIEQTFIETDCPVFIKDLETGERTPGEPRDVFKTLDAYCKLKNIGKKQAVDQFNKNIKVFFGIETEE